MNKKINRVGEKSINKFGSKMVIKEYRGCMDMDVYFPEYNWTFKHAQYTSFKNKSIKCPYEPRYYGVGCLGEGKYKVWENDRNKKEYIIWHGMLQRCYDPEFQEKHPTYKGCTVEDYLLNFQNMGKWIEDNYGVKISKSSISQVKNKCGIQKLEFGAKCEIVPELKTEKERLVLEAFMHYGLV